jgi:diguanylate cyclase (GGDEF)-like protein
MASKQFRSLNTKLLTYVAWSSFVILLVAALASFFIQYERSKVNTTTMLNQLLDTVEDTATVAVYSRNRQIADDVLTGLLKNDIVHKAIIFSKEGFLLERSKNNQLNTMDQIYRPVYSLFDSKDAIGYINIQPSVKYSLTEAKYDTLYNIISSFILIGLTALVIVWVMQKYISKPLAFVSNTLHDIGSGEKQRIPTLKNNNNDELGQLRTDINSLLSTLEDKFNDEYALRQNIESMEQQLRHMYNSSSAGLFLLDLEGRLLTSNSTLRNILNISTAINDQCEQQCVFSEFIIESEKFELLMNKAISSGQLVSQDFTLIENNNAPPVWAHCLLSKITASSGQTNLEGVLFDVTRRVEAEIAIKHEVAHDPLTGLLRKQATQSRFENPSAVQTCCFLMMDLDGFKQANDTYGHLAGDKVLKITSDRLNLCVRSSDIVCRLGGDEFLIILYNYQSQNLALGIAEKIIISIHQSMVIDENTTINVGISIGLADFTFNDEHDFESMLKKADDAMYEVKRQGKNGYCIKNPNGEMTLKLFGTDFAANDLSTENH